MKFIAYLLTYAFYPFSFLFIRKKTKYAFGSSLGSFNGNAKSLFIYTCQHKPEIDAVWLTLSPTTLNQIRSMGLKAYKLSSLPGIWHALTSRYWFFNSYTSDIMFCFSGGAICINLWHGVGIKRIEYNITTGPLAKRYQKTDWLDVFYHPQSFRKPEYVLSSTPFQTHFFSTSFRVDPDVCLPFGYPRNEILLCPEEERREYIERFCGPQASELLERMLAARKVLVYMPTWRDSQLSLFAESMDLGRLDEVLGRKGDLLLLKPHSNVSAQCEGYEKLSNIVFVKGTVDLYPLLPYTHVLITDYSSILYDYILMPDKDVILYMYDYDEYVAMRDFFYPFDENVVGSRVYDFNSLVTLLERDDYRLDAAERRALVEKFWGDTMTHSPSQKLLDYFAG